MYDHTLHRGRKNFCRYCLQAFRTEEILEFHIKDYFKINGKQSIKMPKKKKMNTLDSKTKNKNKVTIYADFESILVPESKWVLYEQMSKTYCLQLWL